MKLSEEETHYDVLEVSPSCNSSELRQAYLRIKNTFSHDSNALYTMLDTNEREELLERIEKAYQVLSDPEGRRAYDQAHGYIDGMPPPQTLSAGDDSNPFAAHLNTLLALPTDGGVVSIDRVPPMDPNAAEDALLVPPATDSPQTETEQTAQDEPIPHPPHTERPAPKAAAEPIRPPNAPPSPLRTQIDPALRARIDAETLWPGDLLRQIRESQHISIEELSDITKVSKTYLLALEAENYDKLPAAVFVRGFLTQACRAIQVPRTKIDSVVLAYLKRYRDHVQSKTGQSD